jgi:hypothetical protein
MASWAALVLTTVAEPAFDVTPNASNLNAPSIASFLRQGVLPLKLPTNVVDLGHTMSSVQACADACISWRNVSQPKARCRSFTRVAEAFAIQNISRWCVGHLDPVWLPVSYPLVDSGIVHWPCVTDDDCSLNGKCSASTCECSSGWIGRRCETLDLEPINPQKVRTTPWDACVHHPNCT